MKERIRAILMDMGADLCGFANVDRYSDAPAGFRPTDIFEKCKSVIVFAKALPNGIAHVSPRIVYRKANDSNLEILDHVGFMAALEIEKLGCLAVPLPSDSPTDYWDEDRMEARGILSMRHSAVLAGIGSIGKNTLLVNHKYGSMINLGAILTDLDLESDPIAETLCIEACRLCLDHCPAGALDGTTVDQLRCRKHTYTTNSRGLGVTNCNKCRVNCPRAFGV